LKDQVIDNFIFALELALNNLKLGS
jgi:hypothetical protein